MKKLFALGTAALLALGLASCSEEKTPVQNGGGEGKTIELEYSGTASNKEFNEELFEDFKEARAAAGDKNTYVITYRSIGPDVIDSTVTDWTTGPDVYEFASDKVTTLFQKSALAKVGGKFATFIDENNSDLGKDLATFNGDYYAYPYTGDNTYYLQYDKSKLTAEEAKSIEGIFAACERQGLQFGYPLENAYFVAGAFFTWGADYSMTFDADGAIQSVEANFDQEPGIKAAKAIQKIAASPYWTKTAEVPTEDNNLIGCIAGTWEIEAYKEKLGDNYACAVMPTITIDGETKNLSAFLGGKLFGVNPQRSGTDVDRLAAAHELAMFLSGYECQVKRFDNQNVAPCNLEVAKLDRIVNDANVKVLIDHAKYSHAQTAVPGNFWSAPETFAKSVTAGLITDAEKLKEALTTMNNSIKASK